MSTDKQTQYERTERSDQKMFEATVALIVQNGPTKTSLKEVGQLAGYSRGLASHRFGNKDNLLSFTLRKLGEHWLAQLKQATDNQVGFQAISMALDRHLTFCIKTPNYARTFYTLWFETVNAQNALSATINGIHQRRQYDVEQWITQDKTLSETHTQAQTIAQYFCAGIVGVVYYWLTHPQDTDRVKMLHESIKISVQHQLQRSSTS